MRQHSDETLRGHQHQRGVLLPKMPRDIAPYVFVLQLCLMPRDIARYVFVLQLCLIMTDCAYTYLLTACATTMHVHATCTPLARYRLVVDRHDLKKYTYVLRKATRGNLLPLLAAFHLLAFLCVLASCAHVTPNWLAIGLCLSTQQTTRHAHRHHRSRAHRSRTSGSR
jgi:hypothetical protein